MLRALLAAILAPFLLADAPPSRPMMPTWWIPTAGSGWIPLAPSVDRPHLVIPVTINGQPGWAMVDTGFEGMFLSKHYADAHGLPLRPFETSESFGGKTTSYFTSGVSMAIGAMHTEAPATFAVADIAALADVSDHAIDAIIGMGVLGHVAWEVDEDGRSIRFLPTGMLAMRRLARLRAGPDSARMVTDIDLGEAGVQAAAVDTGSDIDLLIDDDLARRAHVPVATDVASAGVGGMVVERLGRLPDVSIGDVHVADAQVRIGDEVRTVMKQRALIGMGLLRRYNLRVDLPAGAFQLSPRMTPVESPVKSTSGVQAALADARLRIVHVMLNSPAQASGLKAGDAICAVNDWTAADADTRHWGRAAPGTRYVVHLCDGRTLPLVTRAFY